MTQTSFNLQITVHLDETLQDSPQSSTKKLLIDLDTIQSLEGPCSLLSLISKTFQMDINRKGHEIELLYLGKWLHLIDIKSFFFFASSNMLTEEETRLKIKSKGSKVKDEFEDEDMLRTNEVDMKQYKDKKNPVKCGICHQSSNNEHFIHRLGPFYGPFKYSEQKYYVHLICALWCPKVCISPANRLLNVAREIHRARREKCSYCGDSGAALGCWLISENTCNKKYHYLCARSEGCKFNRKAYGVLCPLHKAGNEIPDPVNEEDGDGTNDNEDNTSNSNEGKVKNYRKEGNAQEEILTCSICLLSCDQETFVQCAKCKRAIHSYCDDYKIIDDDDNPTVQDFICSKCKKESMYHKLKE